MISASIQFNGQVRLTLNGPTQEDKSVLALAFAGRSVKDIEVKEGADGSIVLILAKSEQKAL